MDTTFTAEINQELNQVNNNRLNIDTKVIKCRICDSLEALKPFKNDYICEDCIDFLKTV